MSGTRLTMKKLNEKIRVSEQKIDILERRLSHLEQSHQVTESKPATAKPQRSEFMERVTHAKDRVRLRMVLTGRAGRSLWHGFSAASKDIGGSMRDAYLHLRNRKGEERDIGKQFRESTAAIQGGLEKARRDLDHSAQRAIRIVQN